MTPSEQLAEHLKKQPPSPIEFLRSPIADFAKASNEYSAWMRVRDRLQDQIEFGVVPVVTWEAPRVYPVIPERDVPADLSIDPPRRPGTHSHNKDAAYMAQKQRESRARRAPVRPWNRPKGGDE